MTRAGGSDRDVALDFLSQPLTDGPGASVARFLAEDTVMRLSTGHVYLGIEGLVRFYQERTHDWQEAHLVASSSEELDAGWVLVEGSLQLHPRNGEQQIQPGAWLVRLRDGRVSDWLFFRTGEEARAAAAGPGDPRNFGGPVLPADPERGVVRDLGHGYRLVCNHPDGPAERAYLVLRRDAGPIAAFAFPGRREALAAVPPSLSPRGPEAVADQALTAFINRDVSALIDLLADGFVFRDEEHGKVVEGKASTVTRLLLIGDEVKGHGLPDLRIEVLDESHVRVSGLYRGPASRRGDVAGAGWKWSTTMSIEGGRITSAVRAPDRRLAADE